MTVDVPVYTWQLLRILVRAGKPLTGRELRHTPNRRTFDGTFLDALVVEGLLEVAEPAPPLTPDPRRRTVEPAQFRALYQLTEKGKHAAEYGEYDREPVNRNAPVPGVKRAAKPVGSNKRRGAKKGGR